MNQEVEFLGHVRPLSISMLEEQLPTNVSHEPGDVAHMLLGTLVGNRSDPLELARTRYRHVATECEEPFVVPMHEVIMRHVIRPLVEAKQCYILRMPVACIAQAGLVGEMVALWRFRMLSPVLDGKPFNEELQKLVMGREFDKLGQEERVRVLRALDSMDAETIAAFGELRSVRRQYLHFMVDPNQDADRDARRALRNANLLVNKTLGVQFDNGRVVFPERVARFISDILKLRTSSSADSKIDES